MSDGYSLGDYVEVHDRITEFKERYPDGSLQGDYEIVYVADDQPLIIYVARAYRTADDERPGIGHAQELYPGKTPYTKDSELMNAETSAWGRALAAIGIAVKGGVASANEVRARASEGPEDAPRPVSEAQIGFIDRLLKQRGVDSDTRSMLRAYAAEALTGGKTGSASKTIEALKDDEEGFLERFVAGGQQWAAEFSDMPADRDELPAIELDYTDR